MAVIKDRCATGIPGFDKLCDGGLVRGSINVVIGGPGAGKTTFLLQYLYNGVTMFKENGAYVSFEPSEEELKLDALTFGWDFDKLDKSGKCKIVRISPKLGFREIKDQILRLIKSYDIKRICIDPINILAFELERDKDIREMIYDLTSALSKENVTVILADETIENNPSGGYIIGDGDTRTTALKFLADGLINLYSSGLGGVSDRAVRIEKMRRTNHARGPQAFKISDKGLSVVGR